MVNDGLCLLQVCFMTCNEWNYWEKCMEHEHQPVKPDRIDDFVRVGTKARPLLGSCHSARCLNLTEHALLNRAGKFPERVCMVQVFHFVAWRKQGMQVVYEAYMRKGLMCAYKVFASLPHEEDDYEDKKWLSRTEAVYKSC